MTETGFGPGEYIYTIADIPSSPALEETKSEMVSITIGEDNNPSYTVYALYNETDAVFIDTAGNATGTAVWQTHNDWGTVTILGLVPGTGYTFMVKARNQAGVETEFGPVMEVETYNLDSSVLSTMLTIQKASSTISAPSFMSNLSASIRLAGKSLHDFGFHVDKISGLDVPRVIPDEELVPGDHTWYVWDEYFAPKRIVLKGIVHGNSPDDLRLRLAYLKSFLATFEGSPWRSTAPVWLEREDIPDRHWTAYYDSIDVVETIGKRDISSSARLSLTVKCPMPYAVSNDIIRTVFTPSAGTFKILELGNAPSDAVYVIKGAATNPSFSVGDMVFHCDFSDGLSFTDAENTTGEGTYTPSENEAGAYRTTETGTGILVTGTDTISYTAKGNKDDGSWVVVLTPQWHSSTPDSNYEVSSEAQVFTSGTQIILGIAYDSTNAGGMKLYIDGLQAGVGGNTSVLASSPTTLTLHEGNGIMQPDAVFDMIAGWSRMLSADEMLKIATDTTAVKNLNVSINYTGTLNENDLLTIDSQRKTAEFFDVSAGTRSNVLDSVSGAIPLLTPGRRRTASDRTQTVIYSKTASVQMEVRYRRRYL